MTVKAGSYYDVNRHIYWERRYSYLCEMYERARGIKKRWIIKQHRLSAWEHMMRGY